MNISAPKDRAATQRGAATLFMTVVLLLAVGLIALYTNRSAIMEQRLSANEIRSKQAFAAANAGIEYALAYLRAPNGFNNVFISNGTGVSAGAPVTLPSGGNVSYYTAVFCDSTVANNLPACPTARSATLLVPSTGVQCVVPLTVTQIAAVSCGWSDDNSSVQRVVQVLQATPSIGGTVSVPVIAKGTTNMLTGGASVLNYFNDLTVWTGQAFTSQSGTGKSFIRNIATNQNTTVSDCFRLDGTSYVPASGSTVATQPTNNACDQSNSPSAGNDPGGYQSSSQASTKGFDVLYGDTNLSSQSPDTFFSGFFGSSPNTFRDTSATMTIDPGSVLTPTSNYSTDPSSIVGMTNNTIWYQGNLDLSGDVGTALAPVVLIVTGNLTLNANVKINGLVYVMGDVSGNGTTKIYGALIGNGNVNTNGNLVVIYDPNVLSAASNLGQAGKVQGSWRDW